MEQFRKIEKLPLFASPTEYALRLRPDFDGGSFTGVLDVAVEISNPSRFLVLNSVDLEVDEDSISFKSAEGEIEYLKGQLFEDEQIIVLEFREFLPVGSGVLRLGFKGILNQETGGFWCSSGEKSARRCFPCWDEPDFKATFKMTLEVPSHLVALSNMPVLEEEKVNGKTIVYYQESPIMSTYLVAFVVGLFDYEEDVSSDGIKVRIYSQVGKADQGKFALHVGAKTLDLFKEFFGVPYPVSKLDLIAIPDFAAGATEYYGLATYPETALLYDEQHSAASYKSTSMVGAAPDASQMNQFLQILGLHSNPQYTEKIMKHKPELQRMTLKPEFLRLLNSKEAMQQMNTLQQSLFSGYWNTISRARDQTGATTGAIRNSHSQTFEAHDVVMNKRTGSVGVVSSDKFYVYPIDKLAEERFRNEDFVPVSRLFGHGYSVCSLTEEGRKGLIIGLEMKVALESSTGEVSQLEGTTRLQRIRRFFKNDYVVCDSWVGVVKDLELGIDMRFEDGGKITNVDPDADSLKPIFINAAEVVNNQPYYRGQAVVDTTGWEGVNGRVVRHGDNMLEIDWFYTSEPGKKEPPTRLRHTKVDLLNSRFSVAWTIGARCLKDGDDFLIANVRTLVKVQWQDGSVEELDSIELLPLEGKEELFSGFFVSKKDQRSVGGFVRMVVNGVAWVKWFGDQQNQPEILYAAELTRHPSYKFKITNLVARVRVLSAEEETDGVPQLRGFVTGLANGLVEVEWEDKNISLVNPRNIHRLTYDEDRDDPDSTDSPGASSSGGDASSSSGDD